MCDERPTAFLITTDHLGERVILRCPVPRCKYFKAWDQDLVPMLEIHEAIIEHQAEGIW